MANNHNYGYPPGQGGYPYQMPIPSSSNGDNRLYPMVVIPTQRPMYNDQMYQQPLQQPQPQQQYGYAPMMPPAPIPSQPRYQAQQMPTHSDGPQYYQHYQQSPLQYQAQYQRGSQGVSPDVRHYQLDGAPSHVIPQRRTSSSASKRQSLTQPSPVAPQPITTQVQPQRPVSQVKQSHQQPVVQPPPAAPRSDFEIVIEKSYSKAHTIQSEAGARKLSSLSSRSSDDKKRQSSGVQRRQSSQTQQANGANVVATVPPVDYQTLLLGLADQYISKAHSMTSTLARDWKEFDMDHYYELIGTGLNCIESVLKNWSFSDPKLEARLQLRYANLLFEETENESEAEEILSKGITMCDRYRLTDLKYSMMHLQARFAFRNRPRAALKMIDTTIETLEAYKQISWLYAFRFLRVSLCLQMTPSQDTTGALQQLRSITTMANAKRHKAVIVLTAALEAFVHLQSDSQEAVEQAQRALATARQHQLDPGMASMPQVKALLECLDLCCDLINRNPDQAVSKMQSMQKTMDDADPGSSLWGRDGFFAVPVGEPATADTVIDTDGVFKDTADGQRALVFKWIPKSESYALGYIFSGITTTPKNCVDHRAEKYLAEGSKITEESYDPKQDKTANQSLNAVCADLDRKAFLHRMMQIYHVFALCNRSAWTEAREILEPWTHGLDIDSVDASDAMQLATIYLFALIKQAEGDTMTALRYFTSPALSPQPNQKRSGLTQDLRLLSVLNTILILRPSPSNKPEIERLLTLIHPHCSSHPDKNFTAAYYICAANQSDDLPIISMKRFLSQGAAAAATMQNMQMRCVTTNLMTQIFFTNIVGDAAEMTAKASWGMSRRIRSPLWQAVSAGMLSKTLEINGLKEEAGQYMQEAVGLVGTLPVGLREALEGQRR